MDLLNASHSDLSRGKLNLPPPSLDAIEHSQKVLATILSQIRHHNGLISFAEYMQLALYAPGLGYYQVGNQKFGREGDFITAPELSPLFSGCIAGEIASVLQHLKGGDILEFGAGSGILAAEILLSLKGLNQLPHRYCILELSPELKERQLNTIKSRAPDLLSLVQWLDKLPEHPFRGFILANEVCDAMPVHRFIQNENDLFELCVSENQGKLIWQSIPISNEYNSAHNRYSFLTPTDLKGFQDLQLKLDKNKIYGSEINLNLNPWIQALSQPLEQGVCLVIDYGFPRSEYYHPDRSMGTLMCHYQHHAHGDPFFYPGLQDITAHVDFTAIAEAAESANLDVLGFTNQASFLISCGLLELVSQTQSDSPNGAFKHHHAIQTLTSPAEMGELFKVIALGKNYEGPLKGFLLNDKRHRL